MLWADAAEAAGMLFVAQPTYEDCAVSGQVDIRELEDNWSKRGETSWCPKYPVYRQWFKQQGVSAPALSATQVNIENV